MKKTFRNCHKAGIIMQVLIILVLTLVIYFGFYYTPG